MDLGALELQIFVSLVVVLGSAFVALICDYLKGNNEQLRERNIELRVRTEERERFAILNPSAWLSQFRGNPVVAKAAEAPVAPVAAETVMQSHASSEGLAQVAEREASLASRSEAGDDALADVPTVAGFDVSERRRSRRKRGVAGEAPAKTGENSYDWVRPEVMARVARRAGGGQRSSEEEVVEVSAKVESPAPLSPAPVESEKVPVASIPEKPVSVEHAPVQLQAELEQVAQTQSRPASTPPVIMLRPLPAMKLADELQRIAETTPIAQPSYTSQLLEDVIAASSAKPVAVAAAETDKTANIELEEVAETPVIVQAVEVAVSAVPSISASGPTEAESTTESPDFIGELAPAMHSETPELVAGIEDVLPVAAGSVAEEPETEITFAAIEEAPEVVEAPNVVSEPAVEEPELAFALVAIENTPELVEAPPAVSEHLVEEPEPAFALVAAENTPELVEAPPAVPEYSAEEPEPAFAFAAIENAPELVEAPPAVPEYVKEQPEPAYAFDIPEYAGSALAEALMTPDAVMPEPPSFVEELPFPAVAAAASFEPLVVEEPTVAFAASFPTYDSLPPVVETPAYDWSGAEFAPLPETVFASEAFAAETYPELSVLEPVSSTESLILPMLPAEIDAPSVMASSSFSELLLPTGMQDVATYRRLLEMPNPMSGIVITISISEFKRLCTAVGEKDLPSLLDSVDVLMSSIVRDGDFGVKLAADQWVFVYRIDDNGFSQRRVAGLSEKLWDFQLRHLGLSNISFSWAAVNVHSERLDDAVAAAVERMDASRRGTKKSGAERARLVVNG